MEYQKQFNDASIAEIESVLDCIEEPAIALTPSYRILAANQHYRNLYGDGTPLHGRHCYEVSHHYKVPCDHAGESCPLSDSQRTGLRQRVLHLHQTPKGEIHVDVTTHPVTLADNSTAYFIEIMSESHAASSQATAQGMVGRSAAFNRMIELVHRVAPKNASVLLLGESGSGKELVAKAIHDQSSHAKNPFVVVECSGLTETLFESELFGHERGAFTGAHSRKIGLIESCDEGTLFLDEIGDVPLSLQVKLLRLIETGTFRRVGGIDPIKTSFRLITATHRNLEQMVEQGTFRRDLYYRIAGFPIELPSLRERRSDIPLLVDSLLKRIEPDREFRISDEAMVCLQHYDFPGNIRELRNILERATLFADDAIILPEHLPDLCGENHKPGHSKDSAQPEHIVTLQELEDRYLAHLDATYSGDREGLAKQLGISKRTLFRKLQELRSRMNQ